MVTVQFSLRSSSETGRPTRRERPTTTACFPLSPPGVTAAISMTQPMGVHGSMPEGSPAARRPALTGCRPSASFSGRTASSTVRSLMCAGRGSCTRIPCTRESVLSSSTSPSSCSVVVSSGSVCWIDASPRLSALRCFMRTYTLLAGLSPTMTVASPGTTPCFSLSTSHALATASVTIFPAPLPSIRFSLSILLPSPLDISPNSSPTTFTV
mmetsp:Transcript_14221/g.40400  ORF Transcript_14221/g.40400 Transcript_14221/m.40400 type:complete len:211 (-) Transcript_14221:63-695(-)